MTQPLRIIFAGTPDFSVPPLKTLIDSEHEVVAVYTQPDRPAGRGRKLTASPVKQTALEHGIPVYQPMSLKTPEAQAELEALQADVMIVVAYGLILPKAVLDMPKYGCLNIHASILPRWRGAAPIQRAIQMGDAETGVTIMQMDVGLDTGDMLTILKTPIMPEDTAQTLHDRLSALGCDALMTTLNDLQAGNLSPVQQDESQVTYAEKLNKAEAEIDWQASAQTLARQVQAFNPWPVAFTQYQGQPLRIWQAEIGDASTQKSPGLVVSVSKAGMEVATGKGSLLIKQVQPSGKKAMPAYDFAQARQLIGQTLG
ncbi:Methionyl-tRNA formyltransferase [Hydrogenovibrio crunogenus]|uniref:Methionyl-tRNA formyltransferase n=1 Tax=Hydrogenovibrio crunogenus TaxID=39765 RepID=A0A4P7NWS8_9GAMM|nr:methionyl-tRNA formyltransferase [Hydrogenovibrio crunogenus]QBZ82160.1 Methionyl-tRNA formyltransferase [Hydrogenovibrio crunogenus]RUM90178.1 MAG: methionyl-tRNA formyltransferase [Thiomicrospira sp.]